jgi:hypothetical protein
VVENQRHTMVASAAHLRRCQFLQGAGTGSASGGTHAPPPHAGSAGADEPKVCVTAPADAVHENRPAWEPGPSRGGSPILTQTMCIEGQRSPLCAVILSQRFVLTRQRRDPKETGGPVWAPWPPSAQASPARAVQICSARLPISSMCWRPA